MPLASERQRQAWDMLVKQHGRDIIADVSQSIERCNVRKNGVCGTLTPKGVCCVGLVNRYVVPCEKLLLNGFPLHRMQAPATISDESLGSMGGNTMHLHSIGLALLMGINLLKSPLPPVLSGIVFQKPGQCVQARPIAHKEAPAGKCQRVV